MARRPNTRKKILDAALDVFAGTDYSKANMRAVARQAGGGLASIYRYFESKEQLLISVTLEQTELMVAELEERCKDCRSATDKLREFIYYTLGYFQSDSRIADVFFIVVPLKALMETSAFRKSKWSQMAMAIFRDGQTKGEFRNDMDPIFMMDATYGLLQRQFQMWKIRKKRQNLMNSADMAFITLYSAFRKEAENIGRIGLTQEKVE